MVQRNCLNFHDKFTQSLFQLKIIALEAMKRREKLAKMSAEEREAAISNFSENAKTHEKMREYVFTIFLKNKNKKQTNQIITLTYYFFQRAFEKREGRGRTRAETNVGKCRGE